MVSENIIFNEMSSSEDDYMSDAFLSGCVKEDVRPGLIRTHTEKRHHELLKKKAETSVKNQPKNMIESEARERALNNPISSDNKGFAMLQKLGFKPGCGLGKTSTGRTQPIPIQIKSDRQGLGRAEALKEVAKIKANIKKEGLTKSLNFDEYRSQLSQKAIERRAIADLRKSQRICKQLDLDWGVYEPGEIWFWPEPAESSTIDNDFENEDENNYDDDYKNTNNECNEDETDLDEPEETDEYEYTAQEQLEMLTVYLRETYYYCIWCAVQYDDDYDLQKECPGSKYEDH